MHVLDLLPRDLALSLCVGQHPGRGQQLHAVPQTSVRADFSEISKCLGRELDVLGGCSDGQDLHQFFEAVVGGLDDEQSIKQIHRNTMGRGHVGPPNSADASIGGQHNNRRKRGLERPIEESKAFDVQHMHLIDEEHSWHQLRNTLIDIPIDYLIYLCSQLLSHLSLLRLHYLAHQAHEVIPALGTGVGHVEVMQGHILHNFFLFVDVALGQRDVLLGLEIELTRIGIASSHPLHVAGRSLDVYHIANRTFFTSKVLMDGRIEFKLLGSFGSLECDNDTNDDLVARGKVVPLLGLQLGYLTLPHLLCLLDLYPDRPPEVLHQHFGLLHLRGKDF